MGWLKYHIKPQLGPLVTFNVYTTLILEKITRLRIQQKCVCLRNQKCPPCLPGQTSQLPLPRTVASKFVQVLIFEGLVDEAIRLTGR